MKKFLSVFLAMALAFTCLAMVNLTNVFATSDTTAVRVAFGTSTAAYVRNDSWLFFDTDTITGSTAKLELTVTNENATDMTLAVYAQGMANKWTNVPNQLNGTQVIPAGKSAKFTIIIPSTYTDTSVTYDCKTNANLRFDISSPTTFNNCTFVISGLKASALDTIAATPVTGATLTKLTSYSPVYVTPVAPAAVTNGNAESGTTGWAIFGGSGTIAQASGGANSTGNAMKYTPGTSKYGSIAYSLGSAIVKDATNLYTGTGAGWYKVTFWGKLDDSATMTEGNFSPQLNSQNHQNANTVLGLPATYMSMGNVVTLTKTWQKFERTFQVTDNFLNALKTYYSCGATKTYDLILRLDGSSGLYATTAAGAYLIDEVSITTTTDPSITPTPAPTNAPTATPVPTKTIVNGDAEGNGTDGWMVFMNGGISKVAGGQNGSGNAIQYTGATTKYGSIGFNLGPAIIQDAAHGYKGAGAGVYKLSFYTKFDSTSALTTGSFQTFLNSQCHQSASQAATAIGKGTAADYVDTYQDMGTTIVMTTSWQKIDVTFTVTQKYLDTVMALYNASKTNAYDLILRFDGSTKIFSTLADNNTTLKDVKYLVDDLKLVTPAVATPDASGNTPTAKAVVGRQLTFTQDAAYLCSNAWTFVTADMVKNGTVTYKVTIGNASKDTISLTVRLQTLTKVSDKDQWVDVTDLEPETYDLDPNECYTFTVTAAAESTLGDAKTKYAYTSYFLRLDGNIPTGSVLIFAGISPENLAKMTPSNATAVDLYQLPSWMVKVVSKPSGDTILYASAACAVVSAVALAYVVSRKKNEEEA